MFQVVGIPLVKGLQTKHADRLVEPQALQIAENCEFGKMGGLQKRPGHVKTTSTAYGAVSANTPVGTFAAPEFATKTLPTNYLVGYGPTTSVTQPSTSPLNPKTAVGIYTLNDQQVIDTGYGLQNVGSSEYASERLLMPVVRQESTSSAPGTIAGGFARNSAGATISATVNGVEWKNASGQLTATDTGWVSTGDIYGQTGVLVVNDKLVAYRYVEDTVASTLRVSIVNGTTLSTGTLYLAGVNAQSSCVDVYADGSTIYVAQAATITVMGTDYGKVYLHAFSESDLPSGSLIASYASYVTSPFAATVIPGSVSLAKHPTLSQISLVIASTAQDADTGPTGSQFMVHTFNSSTLAVVANGMYNPIDYTAKWATNPPLSAWEPGRVTSVWEKLPTSAGVYTLVVFVSGRGLQITGATATSGTPQRIQMSYVWSADLTYDGTNFLTPTLDGEYTACLTQGEVIGSAYRVGNAAQCVVSQSVQSIGGILVSSTKVNSAYVVDKALRPMSRLSLYDVDVRGDSTLDNYAFHKVPTRWTEYSPGLACGAIITQNTANSIGIDYAPYESVQKQFTLDYACKKQAVESNRNLYIAAGQLWEYDGKTLIESGFHDAPVIIGITAEGTSSGAITTQFGITTDTNDPVFMRAILTYTNGFGQTVESPSLPAYIGNITSKNAQWVSGVNISASVQLPPSCKRNARLTLYLTNYNGQTYHALAAKTVTFDGAMHTASVAGANVNVPFVTFDNLTFWLSTDVNYFNDVIAKRATTAHGAAGFVMPYSPPPTELITPGRDRLWLAGGSYGNNGFTCTRLSSAVEGQTWNPLLDQRADLDSKNEITQLTVNGAVVLVQRQKSLMAVYGDGPDNSGQGESFSLPREINRVACPHKYGAVMTKQGLYILTASGIKVYNERDGLNEVPDPDGLLPGSEWWSGLTSKTVIGSVNDQERDQARWYLSDGTVVVLDYVQQRVTSWTVPVCVAVAGKYLVKSNAEMLTSTNGVWTDDSVAYTMRIKTAWFSFGQPLQRGFVRRVAMAGRSLGDHALQIRVYYDTNDTLQDTIYIDWTQQPEDYAWKWTRRLSRGKHECISIELDDVDAESASFSPTVIAFEFTLDDHLDTIRNNFTGLSGGGGLGGGGA